MSSRAAARPSSRRVVLTRAAFLACSWTWCIGMFLPAILIAEFGWPAWIVFAVPNIVGAAAMGIVLRRPGAAAALRQRFAPAAAWFSYVTIAFHAFFISWISLEWIVMPAYRLGSDAPGWLRFAVDWASSPSAVATSMLAAVFLIAIVASFISFRMLCRLAVAVWLVSLALAIDAFVLMPGNIPLLPHATGVSPSTGLLWLAPVCFFGFALCPYLDLTFLRVRDETPGRDGDRAFILGFGVLFLAMIALTLLYAAGVVKYWWLSRFIAGHIVVQSIFTIAVHARELRLHVWPRPRLLRAAGVAAPVFAGLAPLALHENMWNETAYRVFMGAYGLLFPAYVWIVMTPRPQRSSRAVRFALFAGAVLLAAPLFWFGFVERHWWALGPGVALAVAAPLLLRRRAQNEPDADSNDPPPWRQKGPIEPGAGAIET